MSLKNLKIVLILYVFSLNFMHTRASESGSDIVVTGRILDSESGDPVEYATVAVFSKQDSLITGTITKNDGRFELHCTTSDIYIKIGFLGYKSIIISEFHGNNRKIDIQDQILELENQQIGEVEVRAEKSQVEFKLDKRVFNVGKDIASAGGSALDVLDNVPSVDVNIEGVVSLRGNSNIQMLINGKPSVLTDQNALGTITAEMIDKVEVVTNPSAKYDAEGTTGIINIIIKKENKKGLNGAVSINTGYPTNHSLGLSLNRRTERFNLFSQLGVGKRTFLSESSGKTIDRTREYPSTFSNEGTGYKTEQFYNIILGTDYHINQLNVLSLSGHFGYEIEDEGSKIHYETIEYDGEISSSFQREEITEATNPKYEYDLSYKKSFEGNKDRALTASATGSFFGKDSHSDFSNTRIFGIPVSPDQRVATDYKNATYNFQSDYINPLREHSTIEAGAKYEIQDMGNDYQLDNDLDGEWITDSSYTNRFSYLQNLAAAYLTYAYEPDKFGIKMGVRVENTHLNTILHDADERNRQNYTNAFPSMHLSYKFTEKLSLQLGYSKRIHRPGWRDLNPFTSFRDQYNLRTGNPDLEPELTDAFELTAIQMAGFGSLNGALFYRKTTNVITSIIDVTDSLTIARPENIGNSLDFGFEFNGKVEPAKWLSLLLDSYFTAYKRTWENDNQQFDFISSVWSGRLTTKFKFPKEIDAEFNVRYRSRYKDVQITTGASAFADIGIRKKFMKGRAIVNLSVWDIFSSQKRISIADTPNFYRYSTGQRDGRRIILGFSFGFGKGDAMEFSGHKMF